MPIYSQSQPGPKNAFHGLQGDLALGFSNRQGPSRATDDETRPVFLPCLEPTGLGRPAGPRSRNRWVVVELFFRCFFVRISLFLLSTSIYDLKVHL